MGGMGKVITMKGGAVDRKRGGRGAPSSARARDLDAPELYLNRELTWLRFNRRVLHEASDARNPPLERLKFFAIFASNIDEFFMKRIGGLKLQAAAGVSGAFH